MGTVAYCKKYPYRVNANQTLARRIASGEITLPVKCFICFKKPNRLDGHHENYAYPLEVVWLCRDCHFKRHRYLASVGWVDYVERLEKPLAINMIQPKDLKHILNEDEKEALDKLLSSINFTNREKEIVRLRAIGNTLQEIGYVLGVSRERIRQILVITERKYNFATKKSLQM